MIIELNEENFKQEVSAQEKILVFFYREKGCSFCAKMKPVVEQYAENNVVGFYKLGAQPDSINEEFPIQRFPTFYAFVDGKAVGIGAGIWWLITAAVAGLASGWVLAATGRTDPVYRPLIYATAAWALGVIILLFLIANGAGNVIGGMGGGLGAAAANSGELRQNISPADSARAVRTAADVGTGAAWGLFISQIIGLGATILGAGTRNRGTARLSTR